MLHAFIDESEHYDKYFILSALIVSDEKLKRLESELDAMVFTYSLTTEVKDRSELHGYDMMQQKCDWKGIPMGITSSVYLKALGIINEHAEALFVETIDRDAQRAKYKYPFNPRRLAIGYILEKVNGFARARGETAHAYLDNHYTAPEGRKEFIQYKSIGTFGYKSSKLASIVEMDFYDSREMFGLQASDLCCYAYQRKLCATDVNPRVKRLQEKMWNSISDIRSAGGTRIWP